MMVALHIIGWAVLSLLGLGLIIAAICVFRFLRYLRETPEGDQGEGQSDSHSDLNVIIYPHGLA